MRPESGALSKNEVQKNIRPEQKKINVEDKTMTSREVKVYDIIARNAGSNITMQGISGLLGFPFTLMADVGVFFTHYGPMLNEIRAVYGRQPLSKDSLIPILKGCKKELLSDMILDKVLGNLPLVGLPANMLCAKAMTWRLGILFGMLAARGEAISVDNAAHAVTLIRTMFPQKDSLLFKRPSAGVVEKLLNTVAGDSIESFDEKMSRILDALAG